MVATGNGESELLGREDSSGLVGILWRNGMKICGPVTRQRKKCLLRGVVIATLYSEVNVNYIIHISGVFRNYT